MGEVVTGAASVPNPLASSDPQGEASSQTPTAASATTVEQNYDDWFAGQDESVKSLVGGRLKSLESAYESVKTERKDLAKKLEILAKENEPLREQLTQLRKDVEDHEKRAEFFEAAVKVNCSNPKLAWHIANTDGLTLAAMQSTYPELFRRTVPVVTAAGAGAGKSQTVPADMNAAIRKAAGRG